MNIKKHVLLVSLILLVVLCSLSFLYAFSIQSLEKNSVEYNNGKSIITTSIVADDVVTDSKMKNDLNHIEKIVIKIDGKTVNTIKKDNIGKYKYYPMAILDRSTVVKGKIKGKTIMIITYDKKDKIIKTKKSTIKSVYAKTTETLTKSKYPKNARLTYKQAFKIATEPNYPEVEKVTYRGYHHLYGDLFWNFKTTYNNSEWVYFSVYDLLGSLEGG